MSLKPYIVFITVAFVSCNNTLESRLDSILKPLFPADEPGAAVLVLKGNDILFDKGYGVARMEPENPVISGDTHFNIASVSKQFTAVAVLQLVQEGKISLEDPVSQYFPEFESDIWKEVSIKHR